jgi:GxxExxY protein
MTITIHANLRRLNQDEFGKIAYEVMDHVFAVHNEMGGFLDEDIYRDAVAVRVGHDARTEVRIEVAFEDFHKDYYIDLLVASGSLFELKAVTRLGASHRSQLLNYLMLCELSHGKLVNLRGEEVEHEFVNTHLRRSDRTAFDVADQQWREPGAASRPFRDWMLAFLREVGAGLDIHLYESAISHFFGGDNAVQHQVDVLLDDQHLGRQKVRLATPGWVFKATTIDTEGLQRFEDHARRFLQHTDLEGFHWINITRPVVTFKSIAKV